MKRASGSIREGEDESSSYSSNSLKENEEALQPCPMILELKFLSSEANLTQMSLLIG